eukprot:TRINITY_DN403_c0_g1_i1.p1 TRINITY_DN403_c0_g1~~TRINITY_DN403_c0_g1_i1.p1  ORF type:complete len:262 (-),score=11.07 TRINITY_DN403_c0_g1_i1:41-826(-)
MSKGITVLDRDGGIYLFYSFYNCVDYLEPTFPPSKIKKIKVIGNGVEGGIEIMVLTNDGELWRIWRDGVPKLIRTGPKKVVDIFLASFFIYVLLEDGTWLCWVRGEFLTQKELYDFTAGKELGFRSIKSWELGGYAIGEDNVLYTWRDSQRTVQLQSPEPTVEASTQGIKVVSAYVDLNVIMVVDTDCNLWLWTHLSASQRAEKVMNLRFMLDGTEPPRELVEQGFITEGILSVREVSVDAAIPAMPAIPAHDKRSFCVIQ